MTGRNHNRSDPQPPPPPAHPPLTSVVCVRWAGPRGAAWRHAHSAAIVVRRQQCDISPQQMRPLFVRFIFFFSCVCACSWLLLLLLLLLLVVVSVSQKKKKKRKNKIDGLSLISISKRAKSSLMLATRWCPSFAQRGHRFSAKETVPIRRESKWTNQTTNNLPSLESIRSIRETLNQRIRSISSNSRCDAKVARKIGLLNSFF